MFSPLFIKVCCKGNYFVRDNAPHRAKIYGKYSLPIGKTPVLLT